MTPLLVLLALVPSLAAQGVTTYAIDPGASQVFVHVGKAGIFSFAGHTHEVAAPVADGTVSVDPADPSRSRVVVEFEATALKVTGKGEPAEDVPEVQRTMESERVLDVARFPRMRFVSSRIEVLAWEGDTLRLRVTGDLTLHGTTRPQSAEVSASMTPGQLTATGELKVKQTDFGIEPVTAGLGTVRVKDELTVDFTLVARPTSGD